jgi:DNA-binding transcriptional MerR regulator
MDSKHMATRQAPAKPQLHTVTQLAEELGVTPRTLRFYEGKGLITPSRLGTTRVYMARDRARMILILRGKRLGFSLREISDYLDLYDADPNQKTQNARLLKLVNSRIVKLEQQRVALEEMLTELQAWKRHAEAVLNDMPLPKAKS